MRPEADEYDSYFGNYVALAGDADVLHSLEVDRQQLGQLLGALPAEKGHYRYAAGKWTINELLGHIIDCERIFAARALALARCGIAGSVSIEPDEWVQAACYDDCVLAELLAEFNDMRLSHIRMGRHLPKSVWDRSEPAPPPAPTARAWMWIMCGHVRHHLAVLEASYLK